MLGTNSSRMVEVRYADPNESMLTVFHRMVMADGIVLSLSSFSVTAALLNNTTNVIIATTKEQGNRKGWYQTRKFFQLKKG
jgi:hypothetical protein